MLSTQDLRQTGEVDTIGNRDTFHWAVQQRGKSTLIDKSRIPGSNHQYLTAHACVWKVQLHMRRQQQQKIATNNTQKKVTTKPNDASNIMQYQHLKYPNALCDFCSCFFVCFFFNF